MEIEIYKFETILDDETNTLIEESFRAFLNIHILSGDDFYAFL